MRAKRKRKDGADDVRGKGNEVFSIHPGPDGLVHQGHHPPEVQSLPEKQGEKRY